MDQQLSSENVRIPHLSGAFRRRFSRSPLTVLKKFIKIFAFLLTNGADYSVSPKNSTYLITSTFRTAFESRNTPWSLLFRSDQGAQYTSKTFRKLLRMNKTVQSFSAPGQPHDNAFMESFFPFMKREGIYRTQYKSEQQFVKSVDNI